MSNPANNGIPTGVVYRITNAINGSCYIGSAYNFKERKRAHLKKLRAGKHHSQKLQSAWSKYGADAFEWQIVEHDIDRIFLLAREQFWIWRDKAHWSQGGYNMALRAGSLAGVRMSDETRQKMSRSAKKKVFTKQHRANISKALKGRVIDDEWRKNLSDSHKGQQCPRHVREAISKFHSGRQWTAEHRANYEATIAARRANK